jgi:hypothetical protein
MIARQSPTAERDIVEFVRGNADLSILVEGPAASLVWHPQRPGRSQYLRLPMQLLPRYSQNFKSPAAVALRTEPRSRLF